ncbi:MAG: Maf family nucleotide pyrophosphatase [Acetobacteraceae bacterium]|nr:Maf family nucleotide pyrophosphatase [Acetobacteraceae bacterium]MDW8399379.1 Maf family nucleotide pyrophosphatase [Acetobacteraceae bacterium]
MRQAADPPLILASGSATRAALLRAAGLAFTVMPPAVDEAAIKQAAKAEAIPPRDAAVMLAEAKAERISRRHPEALVIGADQLLVCEGEWFDKPADARAAEAQLARLSGRVHELVTAVVCHRGGLRVWQHVAAPRLAMRALQPEVIAEYVAAEGEAVTRSVGAYRVEGLGLRLFRRIEGEHTGILGLPMLPLLGFLRQHGVLSD